MTTEADKLKAIIEAIKAYPYIPRGLYDLIETMEKTT
jgi:hypothetical protein